MLTAGRLQQSLPALSVGSKVLIKMASVVVTIKIMPESVETDLQAIEQLAHALIKQHGVQSETKTEIEPIAFGLKALKLIFLMDEAKGSTEELEKKIAQVEGVMSVETIDVRRALG